MLQILPISDRYTLNTISFSDVSAYPISGVSIYDINHTRFLFATVSSVNNIADNVITMYAWTEYIVKGTGSITINGTVYAVGTKIILAKDTTPTIPAGITISETGYYSPYSNYIPSVSPYTATFTPTQTGQTSGIIFNDSVFNVKYEAYNTEYAGPNVTVGPGLKKYIVKGTQNDSIVIGMQVFYTGEVFTQNNTFTFTQGIGNVGSCSVVQFFDEGECDTWTDYYAYGTYQDYVQTLAQGSCCCDSNFLGNYLKVYSLLNSLYLGAQNDVNVDNVSMQQALNEINNVYAFKPKC